MSTDYDSWIGRKRQSTAFIDPWNVRALAAVLDVDVSSEEGDSLPSLWHWLFFLEAASQSKIGLDGHPQKGDFLPPIENPRRMFAGARTRYLNALSIGYSANLVETISAIEIKEGSQGTMVILTVLYEYYSSDDVLCISEERDFIYLPAADISSSLPEVVMDLMPLDDAGWQLNRSTDAVLLFRFSALTFNSHRIHTDLQYAQQQEGYPQLVVNGPLSAILISECARQYSSRSITGFSFRAQMPLFCGQTLRVRVDKPGTANTARGVLYAPNGKAAMKASIEF